MNQRQKKTVAATAIKVTYPIMRSDLSPRGRGRIFGGRMLYIIDDIAAQVAEAHCQSFVVTKFVDELEFVEPAFIGDTLMFRAAVNNVWNTSLEIGVRVDAKRPKERKEHHIVSAYFAFVAVDEKGSPRSIAYGLEPKTRVEQRRLQEAETRRQENLKKRPSKK